MQQEHTGTHGSFVHVELDIGSLLDSFENSNSGSEASNTLRRGDEKRASAVQVRRWWCGVTARRTSTEYSDAKRGCDVGHVAFEVRDEDEEGKQRGKVVRTLNRESRPTSMGSAARAEHRSMTYLSLDTTLPLQSHFRSRRRFSCAGPTNPEFCTAEAPHRNWPAQ